MTNTNTLFTDATVEQCIRLINCGCELVRITTPGIHEAENLIHIKKELRLRGYNTPIIADVHFNSEVAEVAAKIVEKVRINPGNYCDRKIAWKTNYSDKDYTDEVERINNRITPLIKICRQYGTAIRIGSNHGSLSDRIVFRYGNTALGMVESVIEFVRIFQYHNFDNLVLSLKSNNVNMMVDAYHLLVERMKSENFSYPLHIGVTEAGSGSEGRIKSAAGIGALLDDGIGDTIRVSLSEKPEAEIPPAKILGRRNKDLNYPSPLSDITTHSFTNDDELVTDEVEKIGKYNVPIVIVSANDGNDFNEADFVFSGSKAIPGRKCIVDVQDWDPSDELSFPLFRANQYLSSSKKSPSLNFILISTISFGQFFMSSIMNDPTVVFIIESVQRHAAIDIRSVMIRLLTEGCKRPSIIKISYNLDIWEQIQSFAASDVGLIMTMGLGAGIWLDVENSQPSHIEKISFEILQAIGKRIVKTEYISCPTCGRTSFSLIETIDRVKQLTSHLKGLKIAVMGCVVNGPGEMADANYGYVGSSRGKINLYKGKELVKHNIDEANALDELINLIKDNGDWKDI